MLEGYISTFLKEKLGHVLSGTERINLSAWKGQIELRDSSLRSDLVEEPFDLVYSNIEFLVIKIPWSIIKSRLMGSEIGDDAVVSVVARGIHILVSPKKQLYSDSHENAFDEEKERKRLEQKIQNTVKKALAGSQETKIPFDLLSKVSLQVKDVHLRYEDPGVCLGFDWNTGACYRYRPPFAVGVRCDEIRMVRGQNSVTVQTDAEEVLQGIETVLAKVSVYWDSRATCLLTMEERLHDTSDDGRQFFARAFHYLSFGRLGQRLPSKPPSDNLFLSRHTLLLEPTTLKIGISFSHDVATGLSLVLDSFRFNIEKNFLQDIAYLHKSLSILNTCRSSGVTRSSGSKLSQARPVLSPLMDARGWWNYALQTILFVCRGAEKYPSVKQTGWSAVCRAILLRNRYISLLRRFLASSESETALVRCHEELCLIETECGDANQLALFRIHAATVLEKRALEMPLRSNLNGSAVDRYQSFITLKDGCGEGNPKHQNAAMRRCMVLHVECRSIIARFHDARSGSITRRQPIIEVQTSVMLDCEYLECRNWKTTVRAMHLDVVDWTVKRDTVQAPSQEAEFAVVACTRSNDSISTNIDIHPCRVQVASQSLCMLLSMSDLDSLDPRDPVQVLALRVAHLTMYMQAQGVSDFRIQRQLKASMIMRADQLKLLVSVPRRSRSQCCVELDKLEISSTSMKHQFLTEKDWKISIHSVQVHRLTDAMDHLEDILFALPSVVLCGTTEMAVGIDGPLEANNVEGSLPDLDVSLTEASVKFLHLVLAGYNKRSESYARLISRLPKENKAHITFPRITVRLDMKDVLRDISGVPMINVNLANVAILTDTRTDFSGAQHSSQITSSSMQVLDVCPDARAECAQLVSIDRNLDSASSDALAITTRKSFREDGYSVQDVDAFNVHLGTVRLNWNPEYLARLQHSVFRNDQEQDDFFDTEQDHFDDAESVESDCSGILSLSEVCSSKNSSLSSLMATSTESNGDLGLLASSTWPGQSATFQSDYIKRCGLETRIQLDSVCMCFNKDSRHRSVLIAQLDRVEVKVHREHFHRAIELHATSLTFTDPLSLQQQTLYSKVVETTSMGLDPSTSAFFLQFKTKPKKRVFGSTASTSASRWQIPEVLVDLEQGAVQGWDHEILVRCSNVRIVYIQQFWMEVIDYFFEGIAGYEVWGIERPPLMPLDMLLAQHSKEALMRVGFTRFTFDLFDPEIVLPAACCSTSFVRLKSSQITVGNKFERSGLRLSGDQVSTELLQWYNSCEVILKEMHLCHHDEKVIAKSDVSQPISMSINWPLRMSTKVAVPKWKVDSCLHGIRCNLSPSCLLLLRQVLSHNLGETSRHMDEWRSLLSLEKSCVDAYKSTVRVHYSYDEKDSTPSTYAVCLHVPDLKMELVVKPDDCFQVAADVTWKYSKLNDQTSRQILACRSLELGTGEASMLSLQHGHEVNTALVFHSSTPPSGKNSKDIKLFSPLVLLDLHSWASLASFFLPLSDLVLLSPSDFIQVGDSWYKIGEENASPQLSRANSMSWLPTSNARRTAILESLDNSASIPEVVLSVSSPSFTLNVNDTCLRGLAESIKLTRRVDSRVSVAVSGFALEMGSPSSLCFLPTSFLVERLPDRSSISITLQTFEARLRYSQILLLALAFRDLKRQGMNRTTESQSEEPRDSMTKRLYLRIDKCDVCVDDDSTRQFASIQTLIAAHSYGLELQLESDTRERKYTAHLKASKVVVEDCLQSRMSEFRHLLSIDCPHTSEAALECMSVRDESGTKASCCFAELAIQYNPSLVIASQRFLGRLKKHIIEPIDRRTGKQRQAGIVTTPHETQPRQKRVEFEGLFQCGSLSLSLNKEHQHRSLLCLTVDEVRIMTSGNEYSRSITGSLGTLRCTYPGSQGMVPMHIVRPQNEPNQCSLSFSYRRFSEKLEWKSCEIPDWVLKRIGVNESVDDILDVSVGSVEISLFRPYCEEILDYLSNGMPGRGMGATSRAAKVFVEERIHRDSFLRIHVQSPILLLPDSFSATHAVEVHTDTVMLESWVSDVQDSNGSRRNADLVFNKTRIDVREHTFLYEVVERFSATFGVARESDQLVCHASVSECRLALSRASYRSCVGVVAGNVLCKSDKDAWDNLEAQFEYKSASSEPASEQIEYASSARFVRYGESSIKTPGQRKTHVKLVLQKTALKLLDSEIPSHEIMRLECAQVETSLEGSPGGRTWSLTFTIDELQALQLLRQRNGHVHSRSMLSPIPSMSKSSSRSEPQLLVKVDLYTMEDTANSLVVIVNNLSVALFRKLLRDLVGYFSLSEPITDPTGQVDVKAQLSRSRGWEFRLVLHNARLVLVANESDFRSRGLLLKGLAIATGKLSVDECIDDKGCNDGIEMSTIKNLHVSADFQNLSSFMIQDSSLILSPDSSSDEIQTSEHEVPLLLPLTISTELEKRTNHELDHTALSVNIDPINIILGSDDLKLVEAVRDTWSSRQLQRSKAASHEYKCSFEALQLGIGLRIVNGALVVDTVREPAQHQGVATGDVLEKINGKEVKVSSLHEIVTELSLLPRPISVTFTRPASNRNKIKVVHKKESNVSVNVALSEALVTIVEKEFPLLRGEWSNSKVIFEKLNRKNIQTNLSVHAVCGISTYNLRLWCWEPFVESGLLVFSSELKKLDQGSTSCTIEVGDGRDGFAVNFSVASIEAISKLVAWKATGGSSAVDARESDYIGNGSVSSKAAHAALLYAKRKRQRVARPFVLRNRTGLSLAFTTTSGTKADDPSQSLLSVGDYYGLGNHPSHINVVASNEDHEFQVYVETGEDNRSAASNKMSLAFQSVETTVLEPMHGVRFQTPGQLVRPLRYRRVQDGQLASSLDLQQGHNSVLVSVEQVEEKTVVTVGSSIQIVSMVRLPIELVVVRNEVEESIGVAQFAQPFYLPLILALAKTSWTCGFRNGYGLSSRLTELFHFSSTSGFDFGPLQSGTVPWFSGESLLPSKHIATRAKSKNGFVSVSLDSLLSIRNLLPCSLEWEVSDRALTKIDGSSLRQEDGAPVTASLMKSGESVEVFTRFDVGLVARIRLSAFEAWSGWFSLIGKLDLQDSNSEETGHEISFENRQTSITGLFGNEQCVGVQLLKKECGFDVVIFANLWVVDDTALDITFGRQSFQSLDKLNSVDGVSTAEAALQEISSLFETTADTKKANRKSSEFEASPTTLSAQTSTRIVEECFEYMEVLNSNVVRKWWATQNPLQILSDPINTDDSMYWQWLEKEWTTDLSGSVASEGWQSSSSLITLGADARKFDSEDRFRRRRWTRVRSGVNCTEFVAKVVGFYHGDSRSHAGSGSAHRMCLRIKDGAWTSISNLPSNGKVYGVTKASRARWPRITLDDGAGTFELCYALTPIEGPYGEVTRLLTVSTRFLIRNESSSQSYRIKQSGASDSSATLVKPGTLIPFHWSDKRRPELICVKPASGNFKWSGGFDPLTIGALPLHIHSTGSVEVKSVRVDCQIRSKTGGTGITVALEEEESSGDGALYCIKNLTTFPIWVSQDGMLANPAADYDDADALGGVCVSPNHSSVFALDVPFRQGKYSGRVAASIEELLRLRVALAPLVSRSGIETTKLISFAAVGSKVRLNPSKLLVLDSSMRRSLDRVRILGVVYTDGPTSVLCFRLMEKRTDNLMVNPFANTSTRKDALLSDFDKSLMSAAANTMKKRQSAPFPSEDETLQMSLKTNHVAPENISSHDDVQISIRVEMRGLLLSLVDSAASEIAVITVRNVNGLASWDTLRLRDATAFLTVTDLQVDNMIPNAPFPVALSTTKLEHKSSSDVDEKQPALVIGVSFAPLHKTGTTCLNSITVAPQNFALRFDLAFFVRMQKFFDESQAYFQSQYRFEDAFWPLPDIESHLARLRTRALSESEKQKFYFGVLTILQCNLQVSVAPARALSKEQELLEGEENSAFHRAVRKGDVRFSRKSKSLLGVNVGRRNSTAIAVMRGIFKSFVVDALLRLDGATIKLSGVSLENYRSSRSQLATHLGAHYVATLRQNVPALLGSLAMIGNPIGLVRGLGDGVSDFVLEPVKGLQRSVQELDASYLVDGVARGTLSLARHTVGGFADSAAMLTETLSKNMVVLTLDRRYAQKRDRNDMLRDHGDVNVALGLGSGVSKLITGFLEGVTGVVKAPIRGAEKRGFEGFAKGVGKGLLGLLVKPIIGISDGISDVFIGVKGTVDGVSGSAQHQVFPVRPRRAFYGSNRVLQDYNIADAAACALMQRTRLAGEDYLSHLDLGDRVMLMSTKRVLLVGSKGQELLVLRLRHIEKTEVREVVDEGRWSVLIVLNTERDNGSDVEVVFCRDKNEASAICGLLAIGNEFREEVFVQTDLQQGQSGSTP